MVIREKWGGILWTGNSVNSNDDDEKSDESDGDRSNDYLENDNNDDDEDNDLNEIEYESRYIVSGTGDIQIIEVNHKRETKQFLAEEISPMFLFITSPWFEKVL